VLGSNIQIEEDVEVSNSIIFSNVNIAKGAKIKNAIIDKNVYIDKNHQIGYDLVKDRMQGYFVDSSGIVVVPKGTADFDTTAESYSF